MLGGEGVLDASCSTALTSSVANMSPESQSRGSAGEDLVLAISPVPSVDGSAKTLAERPWCSRSMGYLDWERKMDSTDQQQAHLFHVQSQLKEGHFAVFAREIEGIRVELSTFLTQRDRFEAELRQDVKSLRRCCEDRTVQATDSLRASFEDGQRGLAARVDEAMADVMDRLRTQHDGFAGVEGNVHTHNHTLAGFDQCEKEIASVQASVEAVDDNCRQLAMEHALAVQRLNKYDDSSQGLRAAVESCEEEMRSEISRFKSELRLEFESLRVVVTEQKASFEAQMKIEQTACYEHLGEHMVKFEDHFRKALALQAQDAQAGLNLQRDLLAECKDTGAADHEAHRMALKDLDQSLCQQIERLSNDHSNMLQEQVGQLSSTLPTHHAVLSSLSDLEERIRTEVLGQYDDMRQQVAQEQSIFQDRLRQHEEAHTNLQSALESYDNQMRAELSMLQNDHKTKSTGLQNLAVEQKDAIASFTEQYDEHRGALQTALRELEEQLRQEIARHASEHRDDLASHHASMTSFDAELRKEIVRLSEDDPASRCQAELEDRISAVMEHFDSLRRAQNEQYMSADQAIEELEVRLRDELTLLGGEHRESREDLHSLLNEHKSELDHKFDAESAARGDQYASQTSSLDTLERSLKQELLRLSEDHGKSHGLLSEALKEQQASVDRRFTDTLAEHEVHRESLLGSARVSERALRDELMELTSIHGSLRQELIDLAQEHRVEHQSALKAALDDIARLEAEQRAIFSEERVARDEHRAAVTRRLAEVERQFRVELERQNSESAGSHELLRGLVSAQREATEKLVSAERETRDLQRGNLLDAVARMEQQLRREFSHACETQGGICTELGKSLDHLRDETQRQASLAAESVSAELQRAIERLSGEEQMRHGMATRSMDSLDGTLRDALSNHKTDMQLLLQKASGETSETIASLEAKQQGGQAKLQAQFLEHKQGLEKDILSQHETLMEVVRQERSERNRNMAEFDERLQFQLRSLQQSDCKAARKSDFDVELSRLWEALDKHTHSLLPDPMESSSQVGGSAAVKAANIEPSVPTLSALSLTTPITSQFASPMASPRASLRTTLRPAVVSQSPAAGTVFMDEPLFSPPMASPVVSSPVVAAGRTPIPVSGGSFRVMSLPSVVTPQKLQREQVTAAAHTWVTSTPRILPVRPGPITACT